MPPTDAHKKWLQDALGVKTAAAPGGSGRPKNLTDADFPTDINQRKKADQEALKLGKQRAQATDSEKGDGPPEDKDEGIVEMIKDKGKEVFDEAREKVKMPRFGKEEKNGEDAAPLVRFLDDIASGTKKYKEYVEYIQKTIEWCEKHDDLTGISRIAPAASNLKKISSQVGGGLGKVGKAATKAKKLAVWVIAVRDFAEASQNMQAGKPDTVESWIDSMEKLWDATMPFKEELEDKWWEAALEGSEAAAAAAPAIATIAMVAPQIFIGINLLKVGVKNEMAYFNRLKKETDKALAGETGTPADPPPEYPGDWKTSEEEEEDDKRREEYNRNATARNVADRKAQEAMDCF